MNGKGDKPRPVDISKWDSAPYWRRRDALRWWRELSQEEQDKLSGGNMVTGRIIEGYYYKHCVQQDV